MVRRITTPQKTHGGKHYLAPKIVALMPAHTHYVEPCAGGLSVLLAKPFDGISEVVGDIDKDITNFWKVLQGGQSFAALQRLCEATPFSEVEWLDAALEFNDWSEPDSNVSDNVVRAWRFFIFCRMSLAGRMDSFAPLSKTRTRRRMNEQASAWLNAIEGLPIVHNRLKRVVIVCDDVLNVIRREDSKSTLFYLDPPYLQETRAAKVVYHHEMAPEQHLELLKLIRVCGSKVMLSGYRSALYDEALLGWNRYDFSVPNQAASGKKKRTMTECLWTNF